MNFDIGMPYKSFVLSDKLSFMHYMSMLGVFKVIVLFPIYS